LRVYAVSDIHVDYPENMQWVEALDVDEYQNDILILAGDVSDDLARLGAAFELLAAKFSAVLFVPGNHELWVDGEQYDCSLEKLEAINALCDSAGIVRSRTTINGINFVPLMSWYDFSFGEPSRRIRRAWRDFKSCSWPARLSSEYEITSHFLAMNTPHLKAVDNFTISYSHFLPRIDVMPSRIPEERRNVYPVLGSDRLGQQLQQLKPDIHVYGHSHVNQAIELDDVMYVNNAFAYPGEGRISRKQLYCVFELDAQL